MKKIAYSFSGLTLVMLLLFIFFKSSESIPVQQDSYFLHAVGEHIILEDIPLEFGIVSDSFHVVEKRIRYRQNFADILDQAHLPSNQVYEVTQKSNELFNLRHFKAGRPYRLYYHTTAPDQLAYFVYQHSPVDYLKVNLTRKEPSVSLGKREINIQQAEAAGVIESSLWNTMKDNQLPHTLALELSEIYAWTVDFFALDKGDAFKAIYEEKFIDTSSIGINRINAARFIHRNDTLYAFRFLQDSVWSYFDEKGESLRRQFLKAPLRFSRISSGYSHSRLHPILKIRRPHRGVDYAAPAGTPIQAIGDGIIIKKSYGKAAGYYIKIRHNSVYSSVYNHLSKYANGLTVGQHVRQGETIGYVGSTGYSTGPHLDFRVWKNGSLINPLSMESPPVEPIKEEHRQRFEKVKAAWQEKLDNIR
ncbi:MAG: peptidoglycan DD-metalloendopeptidase family protein [Bacteroidales bacterium]